MLSFYGWDDARERAFAPRRALGHEPARVVAQHRDRFRVVTDAGDATATLTGRFAFASPERPVVGDWVGVTREGDDARIHDLASRRGVFVRRAAGGSTPQAVAANVDIAIIAQSLNADFNLRRLERYLAMALAGGAEPLVALTKADLCADPERFRAQVPGADAVIVSAATGAGLEALAERLAPGRTAALLGSSGVGKSTLLNALAGGAHMAVGAIRADDQRGRHTTTHRELFALPGGALLIDAPGMRELGLWGAEAGLAATFSDVEALIGRCRFSDCGHGREPGCAAQAALADGSLEPERWRAYGKLLRDNAFEARRTDADARAAHDALWAKRRSDYRARKKMRDRDWE